MTPDFSCHILDKTEVNTTNESGNNQQTQADDLQILSSLLQKKRSSEVSGKIKVILASGVELSEKIGLIKALDAKAEESAERSEGSVNEKNLPVDEELPKQDDSEYLSRPKVEPKKKESSSDCVVDSPKPEAVEANSVIYQRIAHNRKRLKLFVKDSTFFHFLFTERRKIKKFALESGILRFEGLGMKLTLNPQVLKIFPANILSVVSDLIKILEPVLENGWLHMEKRAYNLVVALYKLCREISRIQFDKFNPKSRNLIDRMAAAELQFLCLYNEKSDVAELTAAIDTYYNLNPLKKELQRETAVNVHNLLNRNQMRPSLYNLILGLNMLKSRSYLELKDIKNASHQVFLNHDFDCTPQIRQKINDYLRELERGIVPYLDMEKEAFSLHAFIPTDGMGTVNFSLLQHFYNSVLRKHGLSYQGNRENIIKFSVNIANAFLSEFSELLTGQIDLENGKKIRLFSGDVFGHDIQRITFSLGKLEKIWTILPNFPVSRYLFIKKSSSGAIDSEAEAVQSIDDITTTMVSIGKRIAHVLRSARVDMGLSEQEIEYISYDEKMYSIPFRDISISTKGYIKDMTVSDSLFNVAGICYLTGAFVEHSELLHLLAREKRVHNEIIQKAKLYKRIAPEYHYRAFIQKYDLSYTE